MFACLWLFHVHYHRLVPTVGIALCRRLHPARQPKSTSQLLFAPDNFFRGMLRSHVSRDIGPPKHSMLDVFHGMAPDFLVRNDEFPLSSLGAEEFI